MTRKLSHGTLFGLFLFLVAISFPVLLANRLPVDMDEYLAYHQIACEHFPLATEHSFREACNGMYDLNVHGHSLPLRAYPYIGFSASLFYLPVYTLFPHPISARLTSLVALGLIAWAIYRMTRLNKYLTTSLVFFSVPLAMQMVSDVGITAKQCVFMLVMPWMAALEPKWWLAPILGLMMFFGIEQKPIFVNFLPAIFLLTVLLLWPRWVRRSNLMRRRTVLYLCLSSLVALIPCLILFTSRIPGGGPSYWKATCEQGFQIPFKDIEAMVVHLRKLSLFFYSFANFVSRIYGQRLDVDPWTIAYWICVLFLLGGGICLAWHYRQHRFYRRHVAILLGGLAGFGSGYYFLLKASATFAGHHVILLWPLLLLTCACGLKIIYQRSKSMAILLMGMLTFTQMRGVSTLLNQIPSGYHDASRLAILRGSSRPVDAWLTPMFICGSGLGVCTICNRCMGHVLQLVVYVDRSESLST